MEFADGTTSENAVALALSGSAAHGDFEVGVVQYLYIRRNLKPRIICGTSGGALAALKLAEGEPGLAGLERFWKTLRADFDIHPLLDGMDQEQVKASGIVLRMAAVSLNDSLLRYTTENGGVLDRDGKPALSTPQYDSRCGAPLQRQIAAIEGEIEGFEEQVDPHPGREPAGPAPKGGAVGARIIQLYQQLNQLKTKLAACPATQIPLNVPLVDGALASVASPVIVPPVEAAIRTGASSVYAVVCSRDQVNPALFDPPLGWGKPVIAIRCEHDIHNSTTVDPGLIRMRLAHGFMRADDTLQAHDRDADNYRALADRYSRERNTTLIARTRKKIWSLEFSANGWTYGEDSTGKPLPPAPLLDSRAIAQALESVRYWKRELKAMVDQRTQAQGETPLDAADWWSTWEAHNFPTPSPLWNTQNPFVPLKTMTATADPSTLPLDRPASFIVTALNGERKPVDGVDVRLDGVSIGTAGRLITLTFTAKDAAAKVTAYRAGYYAAPVNITFNGELREQGCLIADG